MFMFIKFIRFLFKGIINVVKYYVNDLLYIFEFLISKFFENK